MAEVNWPFKVELREPEKNRESVYPHNFGSWILRVVFSEMDFIYR